MKSSKDLQLQRIEANLRRIERLMMELKKLNGTQTEPRPPLKLVDEDES
jgi:hypothetical protein